MSTHDLYLVTDVYLLTDVFENFREMYLIDPAHYRTLEDFAFGQRW